jgi:phosphohistidine phosphatase
MKRLYVMRHGHSQKISNDIILSNRGEQYVAQTGKTLRESRVQFDLVLTAPTTRAIQTAEILTQKLKSSPILLKSDYLKSTNDISEFVVELNQVLKNQPKIQSIALIGHNPTVSALVAYFSCQPFSETGLLQGDIAHLEIPDVERLEIAHQICKMPWVFGSNPERQRA